MLWVTDDEPFNATVPRLLKIPPPRWLDVFPRTDDLSFIVRVPWELSIPPATLPEIPTFPRTVDESFRVMVPLSLKIPHPCP